MKDTFQSYPLLMKPFCSQRPWGGERLASVLGKEVPATGGPYGEAWELSDHPAGRSTIANGPYAGREFGDLLREFPGDTCGTHEALERYPLLVKYIDAAQDLSIQVHPNDAQAPTGELGKTECWLIMACDDGAEMIHGLAEDVTSDSLAKAARKGEMEPCLRRVKIRPGDFIYIPAGTVHAILSSALVCEVQQSSNTTYRLWDWNRQPARELHVADACQVAQYGEQPRPIETNVNDLPGGQWHNLIRNEYFEALACNGATGATIHLDRDNPSGQILNVLAGDGRLTTHGCAAETLTTGQTWFLPAGMDKVAIECGDEGLQLMLSASLEIR